MYKLYKIAAVVALTMLAVALATPAQANHCRPVKIAMTTACFQTQMAPFMGSPMYKMKIEVTPEGKGLMDVGFYFVPKCLTDPVPCRIATRYVGGTVDCNAQTATCE